MRAGLDAQLELRAAVRRKAGGRTAEHVAELGCKRGELGGVASVGREREGWSLGGEGDAADKELSAVSERGTGVCETSKRVGSPGGVSSGGERGGQGGAASGRGPLRRPSESRDRAKADYPEERANVGGCKARCWRCWLVEHEVETDAPSRGAAALST